MYLQNNKEQIDDRLAQMKAITFQASYGDETKVVELLLLQGGYYHLYIDRYYYAQIIFVHDRWTVLPQDPADFETADMMILSDIIAANHQTE